MYLIQQNKLYDIHFNSCKTEFYVSNQGKFQIFKNPNSTVLPDFKFKTLGVPFRVQGVPCASVISGV